MATPILILVSFVVSAAFVLLRRRLPLPLNLIIGIHVVLAALLPLNMFLYGEGISWRGPATGHILGGIWWITGVVMYAAVTVVRKGVRWYGGMYFWLTLAAIVTTLGGSIPAAIVVSLALDADVERLPLDDDLLLEVRHQGVLAGWPTLSIVRPVGLLWETSHDAQLDSIEGVSFDSIAVAAVAGEETYRVAIYEGKQEVGADTLVVR